MSKIKTMTIENLKSIGSFQADFNGCTAIVTAGNNKGKTTLLRILMDYIRGERPEMILKQGSQDGKGVMELTTGERFELEVLKKKDKDGNEVTKDKLTFFTKEGFKSTVTKDIVAKFFPPLFDIDKFLQSAPSAQSKQLQKILGIDFTEINARYKAAYDDRTDKNREAEKFQAKLVNMLKVEKVEPVDLTELSARKDAEKKRLNELYLSNKAHNTALREAWEQSKREIDEQCRIYNEQNDLKYSIATECDLSRQLLVKYGFKSVELDAFVSNMQESVTDKKVPETMYPVLPTYIEEMPSRETLDAIDAEILAASLTNQKAAEYQNYIAYKLDVEQAQQLAIDADILVKQIEKERENLIKTATMPDGLSFDDNSNILVDGFPLDRNQISSSKLYISALRIAALNLGQVKTLCFDASFLDRNSLLDVEKWANEQGLQLLIERPDFDGGELKYELIENAQN